MSIPNFEKRAKMGQETIKLTTAQALVKWLSNQFINIDGKEYPYAVEVSEFLDMETSPV